MHITVPDDVLKILDNMEDGRYYIPRELGVSNSAMRALEKFGLVVQAPNKNISHGFKKVKLTTEGGV